MNVKFMQMDRRNEQVDKIILQTLHMHADQKKNI